MNHYTAVLLPAHVHPADLLDKVELRIRAADADEAEEVAEEVARVLGQRYGLLEVDSVA